MGLKPISPRKTPFANLSSRFIRCGGSCYNDPTSSLMFLDPGYLHSATLKNLTPGTSIFYDFGASNGTTVLRSPVYSFIAPRAPEDGSSSSSTSSSSSSSSSSFTFLLTSDMGIGGILPGEAGGATDNDWAHPHAGFPNGIGNGADWVVREGIMADPQTADDEFLLINGDISCEIGGRLSPLLALFCSACSLLFSSLLLSSLLFSAPFCSPFAI